MFWLKAIIILNVLLKHNPCCDFLWWIMAPGVFSFSMDPPPMLPVYCLPAPLSSSPIRQCSLWMSSFLYKCLLFSCVSWCGSCAPFLGCRGSRRPDNDDFECRPFSMNVFSAAMFMLMFIRLPVVLGGRRREDSTLLVSGMNSTMESLSDDDDFA